MSSNLNLGEVLKRELSQRGIPFKENEVNLIVKCPVCYFRDNKEKIKLYIHKELGIYHCFRCGIKGSLLSLVSLFSKYYQIDLTSVVDIDALLDRQITANLSSKTLSDLLKSISKEDKEYKERLRKHLLKEAKETLIELRASYKEGVQEKVYYGYLLKRNIPVTIFKNLIPYAICNEPSSKLYSRIALPTFFYTNYEARTILKGIEPRYTFRSGSKVADLVAYLKGVSQKDFYLSAFKKYEDKEVKIDELYIVEGAFDAIKLRILGNKSAISLGGWGKGKKLLLFLKHLSLFFKSFKVGSLKVILDKDITFEQLEKVSLFFSYYKPVISDLVEEIKVAQFDYKDKKDFGELSTPEEVLDAISSQKYYAL